MLAVRPPYATKLLRLGLSPRAGSHQPQRRGRPRFWAFPCGEGKARPGAPWKTRLRCEGALDVQACVDLLCGAHRAELPAVLTEKSALLRSHLLGACGHLGGLEALTSHFHLVQRQTCRQRTHLGSPPLGWPRKGTQAEEASLR